MSTEPAAAADERNRVTFSTRVAVLIAAMSVISAVVGWRASLAGIDAADLERRLIQERMQVAARELQLHAKVVGDRSLFARYQEHVVMEQLLDRQAKKAYQNQRPDRGAALSMQAQGELALGRTLIPLFRRNPERTGNADIVMYDHDVVLNDLRARDRILEKLHPEQTEGLVETTHRRTWSLYGAAAFFVVAVFFLTVAEFGPPAVSKIFARAGVFVSVAGGVCWAWVEVMIR